MRAVTEGGYSHLLANAMYIVSPCGWTGNRTVTQMRHPLLVQGQPNCVQQSLASALSALRIAATSYCDPGRHAMLYIPSQMIWGGYNGVF